MPSSEFFDSSIRVFQYCGAASPKLHDAIARRPREQYGAGNGCAQWAKILRGIREALPRLAEKPRALAARFEDARALRPRSLRRQHRAIIRIERRIEPRRALFAGAEHPHHP